MDLWKKRQQQRKRNDQFLKDQEEEYEKNINAQYQKNLSLFYEGKISAYELGDIMKILNNLEYKKWHIYVMAIEERNER